MDHAADVLLAEELCRTMATIPMRPTRVSDQPRTLHTLGQTRQTGSIATLLYAKCSACRQCASFGNT